MRHGELIRFRGCSFFTAAAGVLVLAGTTRTFAQNPQNSDSTSFTLRAESRLVVEDVLVTDEKGNSVHGLPAASFHVLDNGKEQVITSVEEIAETDADISAPPLPAGTFSNSSYLRSQSAVSEVFLVDADDLEPTTQLYLLAQLKQAIAQMPAGIQGSLFCVRSGKPIQIRGMTSKRDDINRGLTECLPTIAHSGTDSFESGINQILTVASFLQHIPGRKNVLWFAGPFPLVPITSQEQEPGGFSVNSRDREQTIHHLQELLAEARVAIYPVDPRGVLTTSLPSPGVPVKQTTNRSMGAAVGDKGGTKNVSLPDGASDMDRIDYMQELASATGGKAYILNNLKEEILQAFDLSKSAYTLSYAPHDYKNDESWHRVFIRVDGPYKLSYRRGYLAEWNGDVQSMTGRLLVADGKSQKAPSKTFDYSKPLLFDVKVDSPPNENMRQANHIAVAFSVSPDQLGFALDGSHWKDEFVISSYVYDEYGSLKGGEQQEVDATFTSEQWEQAQARHITAHQSFAVPKNAKYVLFLVRDKRSRREGRLMLTTRVLMADH